MFTAGGYITPKKKRTRQVDIYEDTARHIVDSVMEGYNGTIFAYGQTGTGKTYTMEGVEGEEGLGVIPRAFRQIFEKIELGASNAVCLFSTNSHSFLLFMLFA